MVGQGYSCSDLLCREMSGAGPNNTREEVLLHSLSGLLARSSKNVQRPRRAWESASQPGGVRDKTNREPADQSLGGSPVHLRREQRRRQVSQSYTIVHQVQQHKTTSNRAQKGLPSSSRLTQTTYLQTTLFKLITDFHLESETSGKIWCVRLFCVILREIRKTVNVKGV